MRAYVIHQQLYNRDLVREQSLMPNKTLRTIFPEWEKFINLTFTHQPVGRSVEERDTHTKVNGPWCPRTLTPPGFHRGGKFCAKSNVARSQFRDSESEHDAHTGVAESHVERSDEPSYLVNIDPATACRGGGGANRQGLQNGRAKAARYSTRAASAVRGAVVEGLHSSDLAAEGAERDQRAGKGENPCAREARGEHGNPRSRSRLPRSRRVFFFLVA